MKRGLVLASAFSLLLLNWSPSEAAISRWSLEVGALGGWNKIDADSGIKSKGTYGAEIGVSVLPSLMVGAIYESTSSESNRMALPNSDYTEKSYGLRLLGTFRSAEEVKSRPYIIAGVGKTDATFDPGTGAKTEDDRQSYEEIGAGAHYQITKLLHAGMEVTIKHFRVLGVTHSDAHIQVGLSIFLFGKK
jgi:outer membrane protein with beta-barrel domain